MYYWRYHQGYDRVPLYLFNFAHYYSICHYLLLPLYWHSCIRGPQTKQIISSGLYKCRQISYYNPLRWGSGYFLLPWLVSYLSFLMSISSIFMCYSYITPCLHLILIKFRENIIYNPTFVILDLYPSRLFQCLDYIINTHNSFSLVPSVRWLLIW